VFADRTRQLKVLDPAGRELLGSVGAAVFTLRLAVRWLGQIPRLALFPDPAEPDLDTRVAPGPAASVSPVSRARRRHPRQHTNRWPFAPSVASADAVEQVTGAARHEGGILTVAGAVSRTAILGPSRAAERRLCARGGYRARIVGESSWSLQVVARPQWSAGQDETVVDVVGRRVRPVATGSKPRIRSRRGGPAPRGAHRRAVPTLGSAPDAPACGRTPHSTGPPPLDGR
jgi:hypothetical protein